MGFLFYRPTCERETILAAVGSRSDFDTRNLEVLGGVMEVHRISAPYKLAGRSFRPQGTVIEFANGVKGGGKEILVMAGALSGGAPEKHLHGCGTGGEEWRARMSCGGLMTPRAA